MTAPRIAVRCYMDPWTATDVGHARTLIGRNTGNLIFSTAALRLVSTADVDAVPMTLEHLLESAAQIDDEFDHVVIPLANAFRPGYLPLLRDLTRFLREVRVPVTILGVGAQGSLDYTVPSRPELDEAARSFAAAALDRGPTIGVRGHFTADYLAALGVRETTVVGCPSMFLRGPSLDVRPSAGPPTDDAAMAVNLSPRAATPEGWVVGLAERHPRLTYVAQDEADIDAIFGARPIPRASDGYPGHLTHPFLHSDRAVVHLHANTWIESMRSQEFVFGHRIHGNVAALLAGTPAHVIPHDSRTRELADYFQIPSTLAPHITATTTPADLYAASDWGPMVSGHAGRVEQMALYLEAHGVSHTVRTPAGEAPLDARLTADVRGAEAVVGVRSGDSASLEERLWTAQQTILRLQRKHGTLSARITAMEKQLSRPEPAAQVVRSPGRRGLRRLLGRRR